MTDLTQELETLEKVHEYLLICEPWESDYEYLKDFMDADLEWRDKMIQNQYKIISFMRLIIKELEQKNEDLGYQILEAHEQSQQFESD